MRCIMCKVDKPEEAFKKTKGTGLSPRCLDCRTRANLSVKKWIKRNPEKQRAYVTRYNLARSCQGDADQYQQLFEEQGGKCAICKQECHRRLAVDHNHETGKIRGLLCMNCNTGIGKLQDDVLLLEKAILYLKKHR